MNARSTIFLFTLHVLPGCSFEASTEVGDKGPSSPSDDTGGSTDGTGGTDTGGPGDSGEPPHPSDVDDDGDGLTENEGDCDDTDAAIHPGAADGCDGKDSDCDDEVDEDAASEDGWEPNDDQDAWVGDLEVTPDITVQGILHNDDDVDRYAFEMFDSGWGLFTLVVSLTSIPPDATYRMRLENVETGAVLFEEFGEDSLEAIVSDTAFYDDGGTYRVTVDAMGGATCERQYLLSFSLD
jgi:hypothetical protein